VKPAKPRILVTGARGFIGRHCLAKLEALGGDVHAVSTAEVSEAGALWHRCDLLDADAAAKLVRRVAPTHLLHLAWIAEPGVFWESPLNRRWLSASAALFEAFFSAGGRRAVAAGSCAEYAPSAAPHAEDTSAVAPDTLYGETKAAAGAALQAAARGRGSWAWLRLFFPYGPGEAAGRFIPAAIESLLRGQPLDCSSGNQVRDFVHVRDVADACVLLLDAKCSGVFNVGTGRPSTLREAGALIAAETGTQGLLQFGAREAPARDRPYIVADMSKMHAEVGWRAQLCLREGLRATVAAKRRELGLLSA
jgi:nucleoside-diphosphate-sugar epimerase